MLTCVSSESINVDTFEVRGMYLLLLLKSISDIQAWSLGQPQFAR
jgi:hypothetical protein